ncbi:Ectonucleoside triphosphate diphosphohydrolase [Perkinsus olseni]|uniref:Ectonucleoside triphosphate diphosphohydrolase n=2 Tax=Perkinsus olseni TaxID=32597 RepID=A0A7J6KZU9_PEROL|nr:Ectonucleoside triphosphate diphosphohydrolase [Perkinsus olseni]
MDTGSSRELRELPLSPTTAPSVKRRLDQPPESSGSRTPDRSFETMALKWNDDFNEEEEAMETGTVVKARESPVSPLRARLWKIEQWLIKHVWTLVAFVTIGVIIYGLIFVTTRMSSWEQEQSGFLARQGSITYKVIFDAGSTGSRVQVFKFEEVGDKVKLDPVSPDALTLFRKVDGGLSSYADDPEGCKAGLRWLVDEAVSNVPEAKGAQVVVSATAGLRMLPSDKAEKLLEATRDVMKESPFALRSDEDVYIMDGVDEARFQWMTVDFAYRYAGLPSAVIDLGGGSVQLAYGINNKLLTPSVRAEYGSYLTPLDKTRSLYVHSWLGYGLKAARRKVLEVNINDTNPCVVPDSDLPSLYEYSGATMELIADDEDPTTRGSRCMDTVKVAMNLAQECGTDSDRCAFDGKWLGPVTANQYTFRLYSYIFDRAQQHGLIPEGDFQGVVTVAEFRALADKLCRAGADGDPWACMDMTYILTLLTDGFGLDNEQAVVVANKLQYGDFQLEAAWPLGAAVDRLNSDNAA